MHTLDAKTLRFLQRKHQLFINNEWVEPEEKAYFPSEDPGTSEKICEIAQASVKDVDKAVAKARAAYSGKVSKLQPAERAALLHKLADLMQRDLKILQELECLDNGKPLSKAAYDIQGAISHFRYFAGWSDKIEGSQIPVSSPNKLLYTRKEPLGVVGLIVPWNFPLMISAWKLAPALACGNCAILKPAEQTSLTALYLAELSIEADFPPSFMNVITGDGQVGALLSNHNDIDKISFTGSTTTGRKVLEACATSNLKRSSLELGGKSPNLIFEDADLKRVKASLPWSSFYNSGQECTLGSRIYIHESVADELTDFLVEEAEKLSLGHGLEDPDLGPLISAEQRKRVWEYIQIGKQDGECLCGGEWPNDPELANGYFLPPTVFKIQNHHSRCIQEEIFGPVVTISTFRSDKEVIELANNSIYGLASAIWTQDVRRAHRIAHQIKAGTVWVNGYDMFDPAAPFGGFKQSGIGREMGKRAIDLYTEEKAIWLQL